ncbi:hypothetical protein IB276_22440 [Ensifer sp. ENS04]|uniref:hypothetical protein n=1 Tax=Ensifer sp. ENS04 TaxID=2769281 RepID=UPI00177FFE12|nr:hypothetical protein [Ensifer sp. ENS04]MBD9542207.1 hypothetical protein [Ensifer sp. ENS04]
MSYILYALAAVLAILKLLGEVSISWWIIVGIAALPLAFAGAVFLIAFLLVLVANR